jgi:hypothetical protein
MPAAHPNRPASLRFELPGWQVRSGLTMSQAEDLLDRLDACGIKCREVRLETDGIVVRWRAGQIASHR